MLIVDKNSYSEYKWYRRGREETNWTIRVSNQVFKKQRYTWYLIIEIANRCQQMHIKGIGMLIKDKNSYSEYKWYRRGREGTNWTIRVSNQVSEKQQYTWYLIINIANRCQQMHIKGIGMLIED